MSSFSVTDSGLSVQDQIALFTKDAALKAAGLQAQSIIQQAEIKQAGTNFQAQVGEQNKLFLQDFLKNQIQSETTNARNNLARTQAGFAGAGLNLSGTAADVLRNEQRKSAQSIQNTNLKGQQQLNQAEQQIQALRLQSAQIGQAAKTDAETVLRTAELNTFRYV